MERDGHPFQTSTDSEIIGKYLLDVTGSWAERFAQGDDALFSGAYSLVLLTTDQLDGGARSAGRASAVPGPQ